MVLGVLPTACACHSLSNTSCLIASWSTSLALYECSDSRPLCSDQRLEELEALWCWSAFGYFLLPVKEFIGGIDAKFWGGYSLYDYWGIWGIHSGSDFSLCPFWVLFVATLCPWAFARWSFWSSTSGAAKPNNYVWKFEPVLRAACLFKNYLPHGHHRGGAVHWQGCRWAVGLLGMILVAVLPVFPPSTSTDHQVENTASEDSTFLDWEFFLTLEN